MSSWSQTIERGQSKQSVASVKLTATSASVETASKGRPSDATSTKSRTDERSNERDSKMTTNSSKDLAQVQEKSPGAVRHMDPSVELDFTGEGSTPEDSVVDGEPVRELDMCLSEDGSGVSVADEGFYPGSGEMHSVHPLISLRMAIVFEDLSDQMKALGVDLPPVKRPPIQQHQDRTGELKQMKIKRIREKQKLKAERQFLENAATAVHRDLTQNNSFQSLVNLVEQEQGQKQLMYNKFTKAVEDVAYSKRMKTKVKQARKDKVIESKLLEMSIWDLRDQTLEMRWRKNKEASYQEKRDNALVISARKNLDWTEYLDSKDQRDLKQAINNEEKVHFSMVDIISKKHAEAHVLLEYWQEKYEHDYVSLIADLDDMKSSRARDKERMAWLRFMLKKHGEIVKDDRRVKAIEKERREKRVLQWKKSIKIQAWWRGTMVRKKLGPFRPQKPKVEKPKKKKKK